MGLRRAGGTCGILSISTTTTLVQATITSRLDNYQSLPAVSLLPLLLLCNPFCTQKSESKSKWIITFSRLVASHCSEAESKNHYHGCKVSRGLNHILCQAPFHSPYACQAGLSEFQHIGSSCHRTFAHTFSSLYMIFLHPLFPKLRLTHPSECILMITSSWKTFLIFITRSPHPHTLKTNVYCMNRGLMSVSPLSPKLCKSRDTVFTSPRAAHSLNKYVLTGSWPLIRNSEASWEITLDQY